jgi:3-oxoacyl-[acyl-carrier protein] reductase
MEAPVTLITGTRIGIGRHLAGHYLALGHRVVGCSRKPADWTHERYEHCRADVSDEKAVKSMLSEIRRSYGRLDHLINNAGIASMNHSLLTPVSSVSAILATNVIGTFLLSREAAKLMKQKRFGRIVNFSSVAVPLKLAGEAAYVASKSAVVAMTQVLAREFAELGITVNCVGPGPLGTNLIRSVPREKIDRVLAQQAIPRMGTFEDVANTVDFFLRPQSGYVTGQTIYLGGV